MPRPCENLPDCGRNHVESGIRRLCNLTGGKAVKLYGPDRPLGERFKAGVVFPLLMGALFSSIWMGCTQPDSLQTAPPPPESSVEDSLKTYAPRLAGSLTFHRDIAPLVFENCAPCHRPGGSGPFNLLGYDDVNRRRNQIVTVTQSRYMPPWQPEPGYGEFIGERRLNADQVGMLSQWVAEGAIEGNPENAPEVPEWPSGWHLGEPDLVLTMPRPYTLAADGPDVFRMFVIPVPLKSSRFVRALEIRPGNSKVVHHAVGLVDTTRRCRNLDAEDPVPGFEGMRSTEFARAPDGNFLGWTPGKIPTESAGGRTWRLKKGADLVMELHMMPSGKPEPIQPSVGLYFSDEAPAKSSFIIGLGARTIDIAPGEKEYWIEDSYVLPVAVELLGVYPHAHYLGKRMRAFAQLPDGSRRWLVYIKEWDFNWQDEYVYREPISLPQGTRLTMQYSYDNSAENIRNPHNPPRRVVYGPNSSDEMGDLWLQVSAENRNDLLTLQTDYRVKERDRFIAGYRHALQIKPGDARTHDHLGQVLQARGRVEEAIGHYRQALKLRPGYAESHSNLATALAQQGHTEEAIGHYGQALKIKPDLLEAHYNLGGALLAMGRAGQAIASLRRAIRIEPEFARAHNNLGIAFAQQEDLAQALFHFERAVRIDSDFAEARNNLGNALLATGDFSRAVFEYRRALQIDPSYADAERNLKLAQELLLTSPN